MILHSLCAIPYHGWTLGLFPDVPVVTNHVPVFGCACEDRLLGVNLKSDMGRITRCVVVGTQLVSK